MSPASSGEALSLIITSQKEFVFGVQALERPERVHMQCERAISAIFYSFQCLLWCMIAGKVIVRDGRLVSADEADIIDNGNPSAKLLRDRFASV
ncbi:MAG: hypothetical protein JWR22_1239 [Herminiimonas sp.]|nr:hypothetical protein [Herminiimonas sp.]